jgi:hypothetical protein
VVGRPYVPGEDPDVEGTPRLERIVDGVLAMADDDVAANLDDVRRRFVDRHRDLERMLRRNAERVEHLLGDASADRRLLAGAYLTQEYAFSAAALTNPSMVSAPDQSTAEPGARRFVLSMRAIGEGHLSSITFRTGSVTAAGELALDGAATRAETGERGVPVYERKHFANKLRELGADVGLTSRVLDQLPRHFSTPELESAIGVLDDVPRAVSHESTKLMRWLAASNYLLRFEPESTITERLVWPEGPVREPRDGGRPLRPLRGGGRLEHLLRHLHAYDGFQILPQLIETNDFCSFEMSTLSGRSALNKGMALFPRLVDGSYVALTRPDRENLHIVRSPDPRAWHLPSVPLRRPQQPWELVQMGNCGSPIETEAGWLVLTHGVGPLRTYRLGAMLLDLEHPDRVVADLVDPILEASEEERDGYVPNVVYSCGAMRHGDHLVVPYGIADQRTGIVVYSVTELVAALLAGAGRTERRSQPQRRR